MFENKPSGNPVSEMVFEPGIIFLAAENSFPQKILFDAIYIPTYVGISEFQV
jgi:hypothetical protein